MLFWNDSCLYTPQNSASPNPPHTIIGMASIPRMRYPKFNQNCFYTPVEERK